MNLDEVAELQRRASETETLRRCEGREVRRLADPRRDVRRVLEDHEFTIVISILAETIEERATGYYDKAIRMRKRGGADDILGADLIADGWKKVAGLLDEILDVADDLGW